MNIISFNTPMEKLKNHSFFQMMNIRLKILLPFIGFIFHAFILPAQSQDCTCRDNLDFLQMKIRKTPAYKKNKQATDLEYDRLAPTASQMDTGYYCYVLLNKFLLSMRDNHSRVYGSNKGLTPEVREDSLRFAAYPQTADFISYPTPDIDLDSLKGALEEKPFNDIEGVYTKTDGVTIGVLKSGEDYLAIVLEAENSVWKPGELLYTLVPYGNDYLLCIGGNLSTRRRVAFTERIRHGTFLNAAFQKDTSRINYAIWPVYPDSTFLREELTPDITYLKVGSFKSFHPTLGEAERFYASLEGTLNKTNLIVDLRNNGGGGVRNSGILFKILKEYLKTNKVYVIINHRTASNAEQFTYQLSQFDNCRIIGNRSNGTVAYELEGLSYTFPCAPFTAVLTSKTHSKYLALESIGIEPQIILDDDTDWIQQTVRIISRTQ